MTEIQNIVVLGAGVMGSGIAAQIANAGYTVSLLDIVPEGADDRNVLATTAITKMKKAKPAPLMHPSFAKLIIAGNLEDDLDAISQADWIIEVIVEKLAIKHTVYQTIEKHRKDGAIVSSNTSTIPLHKLVEGQSEAFQEHFCITHFFNPPRYMRLLELIGGEKTKPAVLDAVTKICAHDLGKTVVPCNDTPGFIANRIGTFWIQSAINAAVDLDLSVEEADAIAGRPMGVPKTGVFALTDLVGIDLMPYLSHSLISLLPTDDGYVQIHKDHAFVQEMIDSGYTGRKGKGGFYRLNTEGGRRVKEARNLKTGDYAPAQKVRLESVTAAKQGLRSLVEHPDKGGQFARRVLLQTLSYVAEVAQEIAGDITAIDTAMKTGYNWKFGPFEMMDKLGAAWLVDALKAEEMTVPLLLQTAAKKDGFYKTEDGVLHALSMNGDYKPIQRGEDVLLLEDIKRKAHGKPVAKTSAASLWDIGDGVLCAEFHTKMNTIDTGTFDLYEKALGLIGDGQGDYKALVIYNEGTHFSAGANIGMALFAMNIALHSQVEQLVHRGQEVYRKLKYAPFPVIAAPSGLALGGGCEILLHSDKVLAHAESYIGLVEVGVGLIPGWGGCLTLLQRFAKSSHGGPMPSAIKAFETIGQAKTATSAFEAFDYAYLLKDRDEIVMNRDHLLSRAKAAALAMAKDYTPPEQELLRLSGESGRAAMNIAVSDLHKSGKATDYDVVVASALAKVLSGGEADILDELSEDDVLKLERDEFMALCQNEGTLARIEHMLEKGKPLRN